MCYIGGKCLDQGTHARIVVGMSRGRPSYGPDPCNHCDVSSSTSAYTAINGCLLPSHATFTEGAYALNGSALPASLQPSAVAALHTQAAADQAQISSLQTLLAADTCSDDGIKKSLAISMMVVLGTLFLLVSVILCILVRKEKQGQPIFTMIKPTGSKTG